MSELLTLKVKSKSGQINEIQVAELLEIDGVPYRPVGDLEQVIELVNHLSGRIASIEAIVGGKSNGE